MQKWHLTIISVAYNLCRFDAIGPWQMDKKLISGYLKIKMKAKTMPEVMRVWYEYFEMNKLSTFCISCGIIRSEVGTLGNTSTKEQHRIKLYPNFY